jgi:uncharacterized protein
MECLLEIIKDNQQFAPVDTTLRHLAIEVSPSKATICIGVRRSGKSTFMQQIMQRLVQEGVPRQNILHLNFFDDRLHILQKGNIGLVTEAYFSLYPEKKGTEKIYCFFDEIQVVPGWESFISRLQRTENCEIYITGSSAQMLSREIATQLRGRSLSWEMFPFSFCEYLDAQGVAYEQNLSSKQRLLIKNRFENYYSEGGFPEVLGLNDAQRVRIHQEYFSTMLYRDIVERHNISQPKALTDIAHWLVDNTASLYSISRLTGYLQSLGHKVTRQTVGDYLAWLEDAYAFFSVRIYDASLARSNTNPKKVYCIDHALVTSTCSGILVNSGHLLESLIFLALRRTSANIFYYKTKTNKEVDFVVGNFKQALKLVQVCETLADPKTRKREVLALTEAMGEVKLDHGVIVTRAEEETIETPNGQISIMPAWRFLLQLQLPMANSVTAGSAPTGKRKR